MGKENEGWYDYSYTRDHYSYHLAVLARSFDYGVDGFGNYYDS
jgi:hypothetical protein